MVPAFGPLTMRPHKHKRVRQRHLEAGADAIHMMVGGEPSEVPPQALGAAAFPSEQNARGTSWGTRPPTRESIQAR